MKIDLSTIVKSINRTQTVEAVLEMEAFTSRQGEYPLAKKPPVILTIANRENKEIAISGEVELEALIPCDRCLTEVRTPIRFSINRVLTIVDDTLVDGDMEETDYLIGFELDVERFAYTEILVNWPMKVLCRDDCRGVCRVCGKNLNQGACNCQKTELDPRMAAIQDVFEKYKEV